MKKLLASACAIALLALTPSQGVAHLPGSDGGGGSKACGSLSGVSSYGPVGVGSNGVSCRTAKRVARRAVADNPVSAKWKCTGEGTRFGHCHARGNGRRTVNWYAYH